MFESAYAPSALSPQSVRTLRAQLCNVRPSVFIKDGVNKYNIQEINDALNNEELIKIRTNVSNGNELALLANEICRKFKATLVQTVGYMIAIYRHNPENDL